ncbi:MAG TPA: hypothetical protein VNT79_06725 [Phycisphaerae bacterium]|nr:hypothetical protein [Phycisphaerae bacterium]
MLEKWSKVRVGDAESHVRSVLGAPVFGYTRENCPENFYVEGYGKPDRPVRGKVLIYLATDLVLYVWIDPQGRVEELFRAVS